jgi:NAD(P)H-dependent FMN reductase
MSQFNIAVVVGSLRRDSFNAQLARAIGKLAPADFSSQSFATCCSIIRTTTKVPPSGQKAEVRNSVGEVPLVRDARVQPLDPRRTQECY